MQAAIHPKYDEINVKCACGNEFVTRSTLKQELLKIDLCSQCHPFFTGTQKIVDSTGRVERFNQKYGAIDLSKLAKKRR
ncbi:MAG: 50S ribosomal protein L31 [Proteobacteria bacterium]|nr:50S ribosomal protein L31 [Pseudomonadota bacterium]